MALHRRSHCSEYDKLVNHWTHRNVSVYVTACWMEALHVMFTCSDNEQDVDQAALRQYSMSVHMYVPLSVM